MLEKYSVFFYTAGIRAYGKMVVKIIKAQLLANVDESDARMRAMIERTCREEHLIARDDKGRFESKATAADQNAGMGGDSTFKVKNVFKSLKTLAGDNDTIFAILDDRDDFWFDEETGCPPENLLKLPAYFFHDSAASILPTQGPLAPLHFDLSRKYDFDLTLLTYAKFL